MIFSLASINEISTLVVAQQTSDGQNPLRVDTGWHPMPGEWLTLFVIVAPVVMFAIYICVNRTRK